MKYIEQDRLVKVNCDCRKAEDCLHSKTEIDEPCYIWLSLSKLNQPTIVQSFDWIAKNSKMP